MQTEKQLTRIVITSYSIHYTKLYDQYFFKLFDVEKLTSFTGFINMPIDKWIDIGVGPVQV